MNPLAVRLGRRISRLVEVTIVLKEGRGGHPVVEGLEEGPCTDAMCERRDPAPGEGRSGSTMP
jgi:hypothetical protein